MHLSIDPRPHARVALLESDENIATRRREDGKVGEHPVEFGGAVDRREIATVHTAVLTGETINVGL